MNIRAFSFLLVVLLAGPLATASAQTPGASPIAAESGWQVTDAQEIAVDGEPVALSPDGKWLAGTADDGNRVCAWEIESLTPACAEVAVPVEPYLGNTTMRWAPDSSAFAFVSGSMPRLLRGDVQVFDVGTGEVLKLTDTAETEDGPIYIGADWTADGSQVVFVALNGLGSDSPPDALYRVDRNGGAPVSIPLPEWSGAWDILFPPLVTGEAVTFPVSNASAEVEGIWRVGLDGSDPELVVPAASKTPIDFPFVPAASPDGRYLNVVSLAGMQRLEPEGTFFLFDTETGALTPLASADVLGLVSFGPDGATGLMVAGDRLQTIDLATGVTQPVANSPAVDTWLMTIPDWADNDTVFLPGDGGGTLITLSPTA